MLKETIMKDLIILVGMLVIATTTHSAQAFNGQKYSKDAKLTIPEAGAIALKAHPGKITDEVDPVVQYCVYDGTNH